MAGMGGAQRTSEIPMDKRIEFVELLNAEKKD
jgi:hypothetical protein